MEIWRSDSLCTRNLFLWFSLVFYGMCDANMTFFKKFSLKFFSCEIVINHNFVHSSPRYIHINTIYVLFHIASLLYPYIQGNFYALYDLSGNVLLFPYMNATSLDLNPSIFTNLCCLIRKFNQYFVAMVEPN